MTGLPLITGAAGFAGGHLLDRLTAEGLSVLAWSRPGGQHGAPRPGVHWTSVDLLDRAAVRAAIESARPSIVYHCAGSAHVQDAWRSPVQALRANALGTHLLLDTLQDVSPETPVLITGSGLIYTQQPRAIVEDDPIGAATPYGLSKLAQEMTAGWSGIRTFLARPFNHAGPRQAASYATSAFAQQLAEIEAGRREPVLRVGNLDAQRDITDVRDTVRAYQAIAACGVPRRPYNVCSGRAHSMRALLDILMSFARARVRVEIDPSRLRPSDTPLVLGSHARLTADTGWVPEIPIEQTLADLLDYWRTAGPA